MRPIGYARATAVSQAVKAVSGDRDSTYLAGGTTQVDLLRQGVFGHATLIDINALPLTGIDRTDDGGTRIGALARMSDVAADPAVRDHLPLVAESLELSASAQLRHMASIGGNLLQRVRCGYYRDGASPCNKRAPGSGCAALTGVNRNHAVLGVSDRCIAVHPSDLAVALTALDARVLTATTTGERAHHIDDFFLEPGDTPEREHPLEHGELITAVEIPDTPTARNSRYLKLRDRQSYEFALVSVAATLRVEHGLVTGVRLALGGVATKPWRARQAEGMLLGGTADAQTYAVAARAEMAAARPTPANAFKVELAQRAIVRALTSLTPAGGAA
ncbi:FAD binding domain-containing protein [Streptomyces avicenniae]|uniref:FAD binding domain-containing protein n=1 Tax=Streptomyces avicenniae TaxID=500153 RepID=UPI00069AD0E8|nr:xanthine dehydrogenase family protein subunit M [Streptomyces avicenniae]